MKFYVFGVFLLAGCTSGVGWFQPAEPLYNYFSRPGVSDVGTRKAMLECGFPDPFRGTAEGYPLDTTILAGLCMERDGFLYEVDGQAGWCRRQDAGLCNARRSDIPSRSEGRRLKSPYCKQYPSVMACK